MGHPFQYYFQHDNTRCEVDLYLYLAEMGLVHEICARKTVRYGVYYTTLTIKSRLREKLLLNTRQDSPNDTGRVQISAGSERDAKLVKKVRKTKHEWC